MKEYNNFDMTVEECKRVFDEIDRLVIVDAQNRIRYISKELLITLEGISNRDLSNAAGKLLEDVHPISKIGQVLEKGEVVEECFYLSGGEINVARIKPVLVDNKIWGAIDYDLFSTEKDFRRFMDEVADLAQKGSIRMVRNLVDILASYEEIRESFKYTVGSIVGESEEMQQLRQEIYEMAESDSTVLITGETGSGKEVIAHSIHGISKRARNRIVKINCAAIPDNLVESELFGYVEGAFTGAQKGGKIGKFEFASGGTVFLDEVDQLPYHVQPKLLRFLQEREVDRIGGAESIPVDIRLITATNKNLKELIREGKFREDLYYRLNVVEIKVPPLREHKEDIPLLAMEAVKRINDFLGKSIVGIAPEVIAALRTYDWPGNIRELLNQIERAMNKCRGEQLKLEHFQGFLLSTVSNHTDVASFEEPNPLENARDAAEKNLIIQALKVTEWNMSSAAKILNISRPALYYKVEKHKIQKEGVR